jgi:formiminotetrahydrofolate cyclodeaminase
MTVVHDSVERFLERLASAAPTPGGGSAAAVMGGMAAALVSMVCNVSIGKKGLEPLEGELRAILLESERLRLRLTAMVAEDIAAFDRLMDAYKLPKTTDEEKAARGAAIQRSLTHATLVPLDCARACASVIELARRVAKCGYKGVISDAGVGVLAACAGLRSAALNVHINAPALHDRDLAQRFEAETDALTAAAARDNETVYAAVRARL